MQEVWKDIKSYEGLYQVSNLGKVRSLDRYIKGRKDSKAFVKGKQLVPIKNRYGYLRVNLCNDTGRKSHFVHRLVAVAFLENPTDLPQINHKDENKINNTVSNLEWCDAKYNMNYGTHNLRCSLNHKGKKHNLSEHGRAQIRKAHGKPIVGTNIITGEKLYFSYIGEAEKCGFKRWSITQCLNGHCKQYKKHTWRCNDG